MAPCEGTKLPQAREEPAVSASFAANDGTTGCVHTSFPDVGEVRHADHAFDVLRPRRPAVFVRAGRQAAATTLGEITGSGVA